MRGFCDVVFLFVLFCDGVVFVGAGDCRGLGVADDARVAFFFFFEGGPLELSEEPTDEVVLGAGEGS